MKHVCQACGQVVRTPGEGYQGGVVPYGYRIGKGGALI